MISKQKKKHDNKKRTNDNTKHTQEEDEETEYAYKTSGIIEEYEDYE